MVEYDAAGNRTVQESGATASAQQHVQIAQQEARTGVMVDDFIRSSGGAESSATAVTGVTSEPGTVV